MIISFINYEVRVDIEGPDLPDYVEEVEVVEKPASPEKQFEASPSPVKEDTPASVTNMAEEPKHEEPSPAKEVAVTKEASPEKEEAAPESNEPKSLYDRLGGEAAINAVVEGMYQKIFPDPELEDFFRKTDKEKQKDMQRKFLTQAFGGA